jgi:hypothetical protein
MEYLLSMTDFIHLQKMSFRTDQKFKELVIRYANFLQQPLELWMFLPCDEEGNFLKGELEQGMTFNEIKKENLIYQQAKERCLFEGFTFNRKDKYCYYLRQYDNYTMIILKETIKTIQDIIESNLKLTPSALIQFT